jgi:parallel beta-helix repeat protein
MNRLLLVIFIIAAVALGNLGCSDVTAPDRAELETTTGADVDITPTLFGGAPAVFYSTESTPSMIEFRQETMGTLKRYAAQRARHGNNRQNQSLHGSSSKLKVPTQFATIQEAVDAATPGDKVYVYGGTYDEMINVVTPNIRIEGRDHATINGGFRVQASGVTIRKFTITQTNSDEPTIYATDSNELVVTHCTMSGGICGIWMEESSRGWIASCNIEGIMDAIRAENNCRHNLIMANKLTGISRDGIVLSNGCHGNVIKVNDISGNGRLGLLINVSNSNAVLFNRINSNSDTGMAVESFGNPEPTTGNKIIGNEVDWNQRWGIVMTIGAQDNTISLNTAHNNTICDIADFVGGNTIGFNKVSCIQTF